MSLKERIDLNRLPKHVAIIMDGNGRWAQQRGEMRVYGHEHGVASVRESAEAAAELGVKYLTLYAFSTENWNRPKEEVNALMSLLVRTIQDEKKTLNDNKIRLRAIGDLESLDEECLKSLNQTMEETASNDRMELILALSYSARWEITRAAQKMVEDATAGKLNGKDVTDELFSSYLNTCDYPDPELLIRTSGEQRISNFLLWQIAYSELYFTSTLWPDFRKEDFYAAIVDYQQRERRFGKISEQINEVKL